VFSSYFIILIISHYLTRPIASGSGLNASDARIHFGEDAISENDDKVLVIGETDREEQTVDLFAEATNMLAEDQGNDENADSGDDEDGDGEPEDDFNAAWEVLEVARSLYEAQTDPDGEAKLKLADTYIALGDVSLETGMPSFRFLYTD
jgi:HAT1-interacting factor 1